MMITATDYAKLNGRSKQWVCRMCRDGRFDGLQRIGNAWMIPSDAQMPERKVSDRVLQARERRQWVELEKARIASERDALVADRVAREERVRVVINAGRMIDANGSIWEVSSEGNAVTPSGTRIKRVGQFEVWSGADVAFYRASGGLMDI
jgi:hydrogenase maturation factor HypF (carbamoyltransferase family)